MNDVLKSGFVTQAGGRSARDSGVGKDNVEFPEISAKGCEEPLAVFPNGDISAVATRIGSEFGDRLIQRLLIATSKATCAPSAMKSRAVARPMPLLPAVIRAFFPASLIMPPFLYQT
jgi:hypothetical protein